MAEKIKLLELDIDVDKVLKASKDLKDETVDLKKEMKKLKDQGKDNSQEFVELEARYKSVRSEYNSSQRDLGKLINLQGKEIKTIEQGRNALSIISKEWAKQANLYGENSVEAEKLAKKKTDLTERLKELEGATGDHRRGVGAYKDAIKAAAGELGFFGQIQGDLNNIFKSGAPLMDKMKGYFRGASKDFKAAAANTQAYTGSQKAAFVATKATAGGVKLLKGVLLASGIGAFVVLLGSVVAGLATMKASLSRTEAGQNKLNKITAAFSGVLNGVLKVLEPLANFIFDNVIVALETMGAVANKSMDLVASGLAALGFDKAAENVKGFKEEIQSSGIAAQKLEEAEAKLLKTRRQQERVQLEYQKNAEKLRQIRDDESKTLADREQANQKLGDLLKEQANEELELARQALRVSDLKIKAEGKSTEALDERAEAITKIAEIQERITGQESEQLSNLNTIRKEVHSKSMERKKERIDSLLNQQQAELELFQEQQRFNENKLEVQKQSAQKEIEILKTKLDAKRISQVEYQAEVLAIENSIKEAETEKEQAELERIQVFEDKKKELKNQIRLANAESEIERAEIKAEQDFEAHVLELENMQLKEAEKTELLRLLETEREQVVTDIRSQFENQRLENFKQVMQEDIAIRKQNASEAASVASQLTGILTGLLGDSLAAKLASIAVDAAVQAGLVSITTAASQAQNLAQATATAPPPFNLPFIGAALAQNAAMQAQSSTAITKILASAAIQGLGTAAKSIKFESGGLMEIGGKRHSSGGTKFYGEDGTRFEAEEGELIGVVNRRAANMINGLNNAYPMKGAIRANNYFAAGGVVQRGMQGNGSSINYQQMIDYDLLAVKMAQANRSLPRPVVSVEDINTGQNNYAEVVNGANI